MHFRVCIEAKKSINTVRWKNLSEKRKHFHVTLRQKNFATDFNSIRGDYDQVEKSFLRKEFESSRLITFCLSARFTHKSILKANLLLLHERDADCTKTLFFFCIYRDSLQLQISFHVEKFMANIFWDFCSMSEEERVSAMAYFMSTAERQWFMP